MLALFLDAECHTVLNSYVYTISNKVSTSAYNELYLNVLLSYFKLL